MNTYNRSNDPADHVEISQWDPSTAAYGSQTSIAQTTADRASQNVYLGTGSESGQSSNSWYDLSLQGDAVNPSSNEWGAATATYNPTPTAHTTWSSADGGKYDVSKDNYSSSRSNYSENNQQKQYVTFSGFDEPNYSKSNTSGGYNSSYKYNNSSSSQSYSAPIRATNIHNNPLMDDDDDDEDCDAALVAQLKNQSIADKSNMPRRPNMLSKSALNMLKKDLDQAAEMFKSPELLKLARQADLGLIDSSNDESVFENAVTSLAENSNLSALAHSFVPVIKQNNDAAINMIEEFVYAVSIDPGEFHSQTSEIVDYFKSQKLSKSDVTKMVNVLFSNALLVDNFKYLGAKFSNNLCQLNNIGKDFRGEILTCLQQKYKNVSGDIEKPDIDWAAVQSFIMVLAEFYMHLQIKNNPITVLGKYLVQMLRKTLEIKSEINFLQVIKVIKLTGGLLDGDGASQKELDSLLEFMGTLKTKNYGAGDAEKCSLAYNNLKQLRGTNWGRRPSTSDVKSDYFNQPETNDNFYMNEAVYFTKDGVPYTYADEEFQNDQEEAFDPNAYVGYDDDDHLFEEGLDEYDADFDKFLKDSGQS